MDRITRSKLKTDRFAVEVEHSVEYVAEHRKQVMMYGAAALAVALIVAGIWYYRARQHEARQRELAQAVQIQEAPVGPAPGAAVTFPTPEAKSAAAVKAFNDLLRKYSGTAEGTVAASYLGSLAADQGNLAEAEKYFKQVADASNKDYASLGKLSLSQVYASTGRAADAEKILRSLIENPTAFVSKEQATISLAHLIAPTKPAEARQLLEPLRTMNRSAVSQTAITAMAQLPAQ